MLQRVGDHEFPKYQRLLDIAADGATVSGQVNKAQLLTAMGNVGKSANVQLEWRNDGTILVQMRDHWGEVLSEDTISVASAGDGSPLVARYHAPYLESILKGIAAESVTIAVRDATHPMSAKAAIMITTC